MAASEETIKSVSDTSALTDSEYDEDYEDTLSPSFCWGCFKGPCFGHRNVYLLHRREDVRRESWLVKRAKKLRELSEVVAGPRWKNFIRSYSGNGANKKRRTMQFQYDPNSYALNFEDGIDREVGFMSRFAASVGSNRGDQIGSNRGGGGGGGDKLERDLIDD